MCSTPIYVLIKPLKFCTQCLVILGRDVSHRVYPFGTLCFSWVSNLCSMSCCINIGFTLPCVFYTNYQNNWQKCGNWHCVYKPVGRWKGGTGVWYTVKINLYRQTSNSRSTKPKNLNVVCLALNLYLPSPLEPGIWSRKICSWSSADRWCSNYIWMINHFIGYYGAIYVRGLTVVYNGGVYSG